MTPRPGTRGARPAARARRAAWRASGTLACLVALLSLGSSLVAAAEAPEASLTGSFEAANAAFAAGRYADARAGFERILCERGASAPLLFNLGNASFRAGRIGEAILAYERALLLAPRDPDVRANLRQARSAAGLEPPADGAWTRLTRTLTLDGWSWLASAALYALCAALLALRLPAGGARGGVRRAARTAATAAAVVLLVAASACVARVRDGDRAVVLASDPVLRVAPYASATASSELPPGTAVRVERTHGGFALVRTADGSSGWIAGGSVARIADPGSCAGIAPASRDEAATR